MQLNTIVNNFKKNYAVLEIGLFMWIYSFIVELTDNSPFFVFDYSNFPSNEFFVQNTAPIFWFAGLSAIIAAGSKSFSFKFFMTTLTLSTFAAFVRLEAIFFYNTKPQPILFALVWLQIIILHTFTLVRNARLTKEKELFEILRGDF